MPPRHGKSEYCSRFLPSWYLGTFPNNRVILSSYAEGYAAGWGRKSRETIDEWSGLLGVSVSRDSAAANRWDIQGHEGGMITSGVGGSITGRGANLLIVDDPIKNDEEAASPVIREKTWDWWRATAFTRLEPDGIALVVHTRWHEDDLIGRILTHAKESEEELIIVNFPAIAEQNDALGRQPGEALWADRFGVEWLKRMEQTLGEYFFSALYQQRPVPPGGGCFKREHFQIVPSCPANATCAVRYWDKAATAGGGDYSVGVLMTESQGIFYVDDVIRGQWSASDRERIILQTAQMDARRFPVLMIRGEREGGSGGKESGELTVQRLAGYDVAFEPVTGKKFDRAQPFAAQCQAGNVRLVQGAWNQAYIDELCLFPYGKHDDQVDGSSGAFNKLAMPVPFTGEFEEYLDLGM